MNARNPSDMHDVKKPLPVATTRRPVSHRAVWIGLSALAIAILAVFGGGYWLLVRYEPRAALHIPHGALGALRVDVEQVVLYEPIRKHVFPVLDGGEKGDRLRRFKAASGVNMGMDLREIVVAALPDGHTTVAIGGLFPDAGLVSSIHEVSQADGSAEKCNMQGVFLRCADAWLGQAKDGTLVLATSVDALDAALMGSDWAKQYALPNTPLALVWKNVDDLPWGSSVAGGVLRQIEWVKEVARFTASADLGDPLGVELALDGLDPTRATDVRSAVGVVQALAALNPGADVAGEREVLSRLSVDVADGRPVVRSSWSRADVERAVRALAHWVGEALRPFQPS